MVHKRRKSTSERVRSMVMCGEGICHQRPVTMPTGPSGGDERSQWGRAPASCVSVDGKSHMGAVPSKNDDLYDQDTSRRIYKKLISKLLLSQSLHTTTHKHKTPTQNSHSSYFPPTIARLLFSNFSFKNSYTVNVTACPGATLMIRGVIPL